MAVSPNHPDDYPNDADCTWYIRVVADKDVQLTINKVVNLGE